jgi:hypothetical protein
MFVHLVYPGAMGYRGKVPERARARALRAQAWTLDEIARELGVAKSSVALWVRDVEFVPLPRRTARRRGPNVLQRRKAAEIESLRAEGLLRLGSLSEQAFLAAGAALYAGEGTKQDGRLCFANSDPRMVSFFCAWLRRFFDIDESRLTVRVYLHEGLDLDAAEAHWSTVTRVPQTQFRKGYRAVSDPSIRTNKHEYGCVYVRYASTRTHRAIMGLIDALLGCGLPSGVAQPAEHATVNRVVESSSLSPGANPLHSSSR